MATETEAHFRPSRKWAHPVPLGLVHGRWLGDVSVEPSRGDPDVLLGRLTFQPDEGQPFPVIVLRHGLDDAANNASMWRYKQFVTAAIPYFDFPVDSANAEESIRTLLAGRKTWLNVTERVDKRGFTFHQITGVRSMDVYVGEDGTMVLRQNARGV
jgi:hypothetical protein